MGILKDRYAVITGANQGLGLEIAKTYAREGASVMLCARDAKLLERAAGEVSSLATGRSQKVIHAPCDVSRPEEVKALADKTFAEFPRLDILVNNAGIYGPMGAIEDVDWAEWTRAIDINLMGSILMCRAVLPRFKSQKYGKIIQLSGGGATNPLPFISAYAASKAAIVRFAETLAEETREFNIDVNSIAPGALNTRLLDEVLEAGPEKVGAGFHAKALKQKETGGAGLEAGAKLAAYLASAQSDGLTGKLISAVWDPWEDFSAHMKELKETDIYTLRRIVPSERGMGWGEKKR
jgi:NAD(P)-dependent dehydrogenase (short-subunit alcohol dehydrogenase family)